MPKVYILISEETEDYTRNNLGVFDDRMEAELLATKYNQDEDSGYYRYFVEECSVHQNRVTYLEEHIELLNERIKEYKERAQQEDYYDSMWARDQIQGLTEAINEIHYDIRKIKNEV